MITEVSTANKEWYVKQDNYKSQPIRVYVLEELKDIPILHPA